MTPVCDLQFLWRELLIKFLLYLKDVKELQLTANPAYNASNDTAIAGEGRIDSKFICPVTGLEMNGRYR